MRVGKIFGYRKHFALLHSMFRKKYKFFMYAKKERFEMRISRLYFLIDRRLVNNAEMTSIFAVGSKRRASSA